MSGKLSPEWNRRLRRWRKAALINVYRGLLLLFIGAAPAFLYLALISPIRAAATVGAAFALISKRQAVGRLWAALPFPDPVREKMGEDLEWFCRLQKKGPIFGLAVRALKRAVDMEVVPRPPLRVRAAKVRATSAVIEWEANEPSVFSAETYDVFVKDATVSDYPGDDAPEGDAPQGDARQGDAGWRAPHTTTAPTCTLTDLQPYTLYRVRVAARTAKGSSEARETCFVTRQVPRDTKGAVGPLYSWSQTIAEVVVRFPMPAGVRAGDLEISGKATALRVALKTTGVVLCDGALGGEVVADEVSWQFADPYPPSERERHVLAAGGRILEVTLPKKDPVISQRPWAAVIIKETGVEYTSAERLAELHLKHPRIDLTLIKEEVPELSEHHMKELHELMQGAPLGAGGDDD